MDTPKKENRMILPPAPAIPSRAAIPPDYEEMIWICM